MPHQTRVHVGSTATCIMHIYLCPAPTRHDARASLLSALHLLPRTLSPARPSLTSSPPPSPLLAPPSYCTTPLALAAPGCVVGRGSNGSCSSDCCVVDTCAAGSLADLAGFRRELEGQHGLHGNGHGHGHGNKNAHVHGNGELVEEGKKDRSYAEDCRVFTWEKPHKMHNVMVTVWDEFTVAHAVGWCAKALIIRDRRMLLLLSTAFELTERMYRHLLPNFNECWWDSIILDIMLCNTLGMEVGLWLLQAFHMPRFDWFTGVSSLIAHKAPSFPHLVAATRQSLVAALLFLLVLAADLCAFFLKHCLALPPLHPFNSLRLCLWAALSLPAAHCLHSLLHSPALACPCPSASGAGRARGRTAGENGGGRGEGEHQRKEDEIRVRLTAGRHSGLIDCATNGIVAGAAHAIQICNLGSNFTSLLSNPASARPVSCSDLRGGCFSSTWGAGAVVCSGGMGQAFRKLFDTLFGNREMRVLMLGLDAAGKTTILYKLHIGEILSTVPTIGFNVEKVQYKNVQFTVWDVGGQEKLRPMWRNYFNNTDALIYVVDSLDRERVRQAAQEFQSIVNDPLMRNSALLVFANKQDLKGAMSPLEVCEIMGLQQLRNRYWHIQGTSAPKGEGLFEGLDWLASTLKTMQAKGLPTSVTTPTAGAA
ncbi:unnamed protein product [Closterium sp. Yama58-4]|nr:unnamed protein product [Closterium sp. Yama58-4]